MKVIDNYLQEGSKQKLELITNFHKKFYKYGDVPIFDPPFKQMVQKKIINSSSSGMEIKYLLLLFEDFTVTSLYGDEKIEGELDSNRKQIRKAFLKFIKNDNETKLDNGWEKFIYRYYDLMNQTIYIDILTNLLYPILGNDGKACINPEYTVDEPSTNEMMLYKDTLIALHMADFSNQLTRYIEKKKQPFSNQIQSLSNLISGKYRQIIFTILKPWFLAYDLSNNCPEFTGPASSEFWEGNLDKTKIARISILNSICDEYTKYNKFFASMITKLI